ncbi:uncharacterized protein LOC112269383 [Brachypodium distachyon]|uniref:uncharacterized protein LOC112269383 n=1 Tax=Brachypodium distachyon TaxID=15368 RepID=UPI00052FF0BE|nr:uncharacterized protein LOC112269383 [Brachypodium distachyon]|eukprot:XP_024311827.1 uncharacterized protein LOC112269383 [Brachypodium distachyon]
MAARKAYHLQAAEAAAANNPPMKVAPRKDVQAQAAAELSVNWTVTGKRGRLPLASAGAAGSAASSSSVTTALDLESSFCSEDEEAAMILVQLSGQEERGPGDDESEEEMLVPVAEHQIAPAAVSEHDIVQQADRLPAEHVAGVQDVAMLDADAPEPEVEQPMVPDDHVSGAAGASALLPMMPGAHVSGGAALQVQQADKCSAPPMEHTFGIITESSLAAAIEQAPAPHDPQPSRATESFLRTPTRPRIPSPASTRRFVCPRCDKKFPTYQALGGHMASHNRANKYGADGPQHQQLVAQLAVARAAQQSLRASNANTAGTGTTNSGRRSMTNLPPPPKEPILLAPPAVHPCSRCELVFRTGQALGGHMRRHWIADKVRADAAEARAAMDAAAGEAVPAAEAAVQAAAAEAVVAAAASVPAAAPRGEPLDFDLNEMPGEE